MILREVDPESKFELEFLYDLLIERPVEANISHRKMPTWDEHLKFVKSKPYRNWWTLIDEDMIIGTAYITKHGEIGIFIKKDYQKVGYATDAIKEIMKNESTILANINPANERSIKLFEKMGFRHIQNTYRWEKKPLD